ncbi:MAG: hypothetical protein KDA84_17860 [Planctomycetaceae bacterium]|nr:hypothetical protein [Planctomycetaceae bacterium]
MTKEHQTENADSGDTPIPEWNHSEREREFSHDTFPFTQTIYAFLLTPAASVGIITVMALLSFPKTTIDLLFDIVFVLPMNILFVGIIVKLWRKPLEANLMGFSARKWLVLNVVAYVLGAGTTGLVW